MDESAASVGLEIKDPNVRNDFEEVIHDIPQAFIKKYNAASPLDLLIVEIGDDPENDFQLIERLQSSGLVGEIFLTSSCFEPNFLIRALRAGVKEFIPQPLQKGELRNALLKFITRIEHRSSSAIKEIRRGKIINVMGSKGGVGTTTVAVNLATALRRSSEHAPSVALIDMNLLFGEIPVFLNIDSNFNWAEVARNISRLDSTYLMSTLAKHDSGVYVLPSPSGLDGGNVATPEIIETILEVMKKQFDYIVIDIGQSLDDVSLRIMEMSDLVFLIAILSLPCLTNVKKLLWTFQKLGYPQQENVKIIINRYHKKSLISLKEAEGVLKQKIFSLIANDYPTTMSAINQGKPLAVIDKNVEIVKDFNQLGKSVLHASRN
jgi:pilus assembly protein CpaE